jgi:hypothetical protein
MVKATQAGRLPDYDLRMYIPATRVNTTQDAAACTAGIKCKYRRPNLECMNIKTDMDRDTDMVPCQCGNFVEASVNSVLCDFP